MITILVVGERERAALDRLASENPSLELLHAGDVEEALDRLARNRRIDAVLLLVGPETAREIAELILEEDPAGPPIFVPSTTSEVEGTQTLVARTAEEILATIVRELSS